MVTSARIQPASNSDFLSSHPGVLPFLPQTPLFGTDGIRGKAGELLNAPFAQAVGFWAGRVLRTAAGTSGPVLIGQDSRNSSDMLAMSLASGLTAAGLEVWHLGLCPTPCVAYACAKTEAIAGIMVSASHNPPEDNGIKFFDWRGWKLSASIADRIEACLRGTVVDELEMTRWGKYYPRPLLVNDYLEALRLGLPSGLNLAGMRVVLDLAWGAATGVAPQLFRTLGAEVIELHPRPDGDRINVNCGSTHLNSLQTAVQAHEADLGLAFDGDADRVLAVDGRGRVVDGDAILYFWGRSLQAAGRLPDNLLVATVMANLGFERAWLALGGQLIRTKVGDKYVQQSMWETGAMLGGEQSGHIICHHYSCSGDGLQTAVHLAALTQQAGVSLAELMDESFPTYPQLLRNVRVEDCSRRRNWQSCEPLQGEIVRAETAMGDEGRVLVRASGTEPVIRVMVEAADGALADYWCEHLVATVERYLA